MVICIEEKIIIRRSASEVFDFFAKPENDAMWRAEVNRSLPGGEISLGVKLSEYSHLSKRQPDFRQDLTCVLFEPQRRIVFETPKDARFFLRSDRQVSVIGQNETVLIYNLSFDSGIVKHALGFALPGFLVRMKAKADQKKYLLKLKKILEQG